MSINDAQMVGVERPLISREARYFSAIISAIRQAAARSLTALCISEKSKLDEGRGCHCSKLNSARQESCKIAMQERGKYDEKEIQIINKQ